MTATTQAPTVPASTASRPTNWMRGGPDEPAVLGMCREHVHQLSGGVQVERLGARGADRQAFA
ncbi:MAG: hypothetical protein IPO80_08980 [Propionibacteriaceae bacterium]|nr:hypothetical protein [Propionibacteriaceae bacterium]